MHETSHNHVEHVFGAGNVARPSTAQAAHNTAQQLREDQRGNDALAQGLLLESADALTLASELVADQNTRANLRGHAAELTALSEVWSPPPSETRVVRSTRRARRQGTTRTVEPG